MNAYTTEDQSLYDLEYFLSIEYRYFSHAHRNRLKNIRTFLGHVRSKSILDIGGGTGHIADLMHRQGAVVHVVDYADAAVRFGKERFPHLRFSQVSVYDVRSLAAKYDIVTCFDVIEHLEHPERMLQAAHSVLAERGELFLSTDNAQSPLSRNPWMTNLDRLFGRLSPEGRDFDMIKRVEKYRREFLGKDYHRSHIRAYDVAALLAELRNTGWDVLDYRTFHIWTHPIKEWATGLMGRNAGTSVIVRCRSR